MSQLTLSGSWGDAADMLLALLKAGFLLNFDSSKYPEEHLHITEPALHLAAVFSREDFPICPNRWVVWLRVEDSDLSMAAYKAGALSVFPPSISPEVLIQAINNVSFETTSINMVNCGFQHVRRGASIFLDPGQVLTIHKGVLATNMIHVDGTQVLLGLTGAGFLLVGHPDDECYIQIMAHTSAVISIQPWEKAAASLDFSEKLQVRLQQMEAWAAMQARPNLNQRVLGIFYLLAEQFGVAHPNGTLINVRLTHTQLASAVGATRTTITRVLGELSVLGKINIEGEGKNIRIVLHEKIITHHTCHK